MRRPRLNDLLNFASIEKQSDLLGQYLETGGTLQDILRLSPETLDSIYATGYRHYEAKNYVQARQLFALLTLFCPAVSKYWWALGGTHVALKDYRTALDVYAVLSLLEPENPQPYFFSAFCRQQLGEPKEAQEAFKTATLIKAKKESY